MNTEPTLPTAPQPKTNKLTVWSLILGILGLIFCVVGGVFAIPGLICGIIGMKRVRNSGGSEKGHGMAIAGTVLSAVGLVIFPVVALMTAIAVPNFMKARDVSMKNSCIVNLKSLDSAKAVWALENRKPEGAIATESDLVGQTKYIQQKPVCPEGGIYSLNPVGAKPTCSMPGHSF